MYFSAAIHHEALNNAAGKEVFDESDSISQETVEMEVKS